MSELLLGRYELLELIGEGAMGAVYRAHDTTLGRVVALKVMNASLGASPELVARFEREARSLAGLQHPNIVTIYDFLKPSGNLCLVMELVAGEPLDKAIKTGLALTVQQKLAFMAQACRALQYAHDKGIIHRDLKPSNILMLPDCSPKIIDFGIAKLMDSKLTRTNTRIGTIAYSSPEQLNGDAVDHRTDIFAAGVVLFELLSGICPFEGVHTTATMKKILIDPTPNLPENISGVPQSVRAILGRALAKDPKLRYQSAADFAEALEQSETSPDQGHSQRGIDTGAQPSPRPLPSFVGASGTHPSTDSKTRSKKWIIVAGVAFCALVAAAVSAVVVISNQHANPSSQPISQTSPQTAAVTAPPLPLQQELPKSAPPQNEQDKLSEPSGANESTDSQSVAARVVTLLKQNDFAGAATLTAKACNDGDRRACDMLGDLYKKGIGVTQSDSEAEGYYQKACDGGAPVGCSDLGDSYANGEGVKQDNGHAANLYYKGCNGGDGHGCYSLGLMYYNGTYVQEDDARAADYFEKGCNAKEYDSCALLGIAYVSAKGRDKDLDRGAKLIVEACNNNSGIGCWTEGKVSETNKDVETAKQLYEKACNLHFQTACDDRKKLE